MATPLIRYAEDITGINPDNYVSGERHVLANRRIRSVVPTEGAFFSDSLSIVEVDTNRTLTKGVHYVPAEYLRIPSEIARKRVYGLILIIDPAVSPEVDINYQAIGGKYIGQTETLKHLLEQKRDDGSEYSYYDVIDRPDEFNPLFHFHNLDEGMKFEYIVFQLERLRNAILWSDSPVYQDIYNYVENLLTDLDKKLQLKMDSFLTPLLYEFKRLFTKNSIGLGNVENLRVATAEEGSKAGKQTTKIGDFIERKYVALEAIVAFKDSLYEAFVSKEKTNIGRNQAVFVAPKKKTLFDLPNGAVVSFLSKREALGITDGFDPNAYPTGISEDKRVTIVKVVNNKNNGGGVFLAYLMDGSAAYIGASTTGSLADNIVWRRFLFSEDLQTFVDMLSGHITNTNNPHKLRKDQVDLGNVENLPVITREEILCLKSVRKYMTFDAFLLFMKTYMIGKNGSSADPGAQSNEPLENCQIIYCPCSPCGCGPGGGSSPSTPTTVYPPAGTLVTWMCRGSDKWGVYNNGTGGTYDQVILTNSPECGYVPPPVPPAPGTLLGWFCSGRDKWGKYADGGGGSYDNLIMSGSPECGGTVPTPTGGPVTPPPTVPGAATISLAITPSSLIVGSADASMNTTIQSLVVGKSYNVEWRIKQENDVNYSSFGDSQTFVADAVFKNMSAPLKNNGDVLPGRATFIAKITENGNAANANQSNPVSFTFMGDKAIRFKIDGTNAGKQINASIKPSVEITFENFPVSRDISYSLLGYGITIGGDRSVPIQANGRGTISQQSVTDLINSESFRGSVQYQIVARWTQASWAGGGTLEVRSNTVTIDWIGATTTNPAAGTLISSGCKSGNMVGVYANGSGGTYENVITYNAPTCANVQPPSNAAPVVNATRAFANVAWLDRQAITIIATGLPSSTTIECGLFKYGSAVNISGTSSRTTSDGKITFNLTPTNDKSENVGNYNYYIKLTWMVNGVSTYIESTYLNWTNGGATTTPPPASTPTVLIIRSLSTVNWDQVQPYQLNLDNLPIGKNINYKVTAVNSGIVINSGNFVPTTVSPGIGSSITNNRTDLLGDLAYRAEISWNDSTGDHTVYSNQVRWTNLPATTTTPPVVIPPTLPGNTTPAAGTLMSSYCKNFVDKTYLSADLYGIYADGLGGVYHKLYKANDASCVMLNRNIGVTVSFTPSTVPWQGSTNWKVYATGFAINRSINLTLTMTAPNGTTTEQTITIPTKTNNLGAVEMTGTLINNNESAIGTYRFSGRVVDPTPENITYTGGTFTGATVLFVGPAVAPPPPQSPSQLYYRHSDGSWKPSFDGQIIYGDGVGGYVGLAAVFTNLSVPPGTPVILRLMNASGNATFLNAQFTGWSEGDYNLFDIKPQQPNSVIVQAAGRPTAVCEPIYDPGSGTVQQITGAQLSGNWFAMKFRYDPTVQTTAESFDQTFDVVISVHTTGAGFPMIAQFNRTYKFRTTNTKVAGKPSGIYDGGA